MCGFVKALLENKSRWFMINIDNQVLIYLRANYAAKHLRSYVL